MAARSLRPARRAFLPHGLKAGAEITAKDMSSRQELIDSAVDGRAWYRQRPAARTDHCHSDDTALQVDECTAFASWTECQIQTNEAVDGAAANAVPSPTRESDDAERGEWPAIMISHRHDDLTSAERSVGGGRYGKSVRLETEHRDISCGIAAREQSVGDAPGRKRKLDVLIALQGFFGGNDHPGTPMDAAYGPVPFTMDSDNAAGGALHQLRGVLRECEKGAAGFDHNCFSKIRGYGPDMAAT